MTKVQQQKISIVSEGTRLAATLALAGSTAPLLVLVHGFAGNKNESGLFTQAADFFGENGFSVLRFDFRGCGENGGSFKRVRLHDLITDLHSVFGYIKSDPLLQPLPLGFVGFSLGAGIGLLADPPVDAYLFWSPAIYTRTDMVPRYRPELDSKGYVIKGSVKVSKEFIYDLDSDAIPNALKAVRAPVFLVHGTGDQRIPCKSSEKASRVLMNASIKTKISLIPDADHSFRNDLDLRRRVFSESLTWLRDLLVETNTSDQSSHSFPLPHTLGSHHADRPWAFPLA